MCVCVCSCMSVYVGPYMCMFVFICYHMRYACVHARSFTYVHSFVYLSVSVFVFTVIVWSGRGGGPFAAYPPVLPECFFHMSVCLCAYLLVYACVPLSICVCLLIHLQTVCLPFCLSACLSASLLIFSSLFLVFACMPIHLYVPRYILPARLAVCVSVFICLPVCLTVVSPVRPSVRCPSLDVWLPDRLPVQCTMCRVRFRGLTQDDHVTPVYHVTLPHQNPLRRTHSPTLLFSRTPEALFQTTSASTKPLQPTTHHLPSTQTSSRSPTTPPHIDSSQAWS